MFHSPLHSCCGSLKPLVTFSLSFSRDCSLSPPAFSHPLPCSSPLLLTGLYGKCHFLQLSLHRALPFLPAPSPPNTIHVLSRATDFYFPLILLWSTHSLFLSPTQHVLQLHPVICGSFATVTSRFPFFHVLIPSILGQKDAVSQSFPLWCASEQCQPQTQLQLLSSFFCQLK